MIIYDPENEEFDSVILASYKSSDNLKDGDSKDHQHRSYHKKAKKVGWYRICLSAHRLLFEGNPDLKYEMSIQIDSLFEAQYERNEEE